MHKPDRAGHFAFRGLGFSLLVTSFLRGLQLELVPQESRGHARQLKKFIEGYIPLPDGKEEYHQIKEGLS